MDIVKWRAKARNSQNYISAVSRINDYLNHELCDKNAFGDADSQLFEENYTEAEDAIQKGNKSDRGKTFNDEVSDYALEDYSEESDFDDDDVGAKPSIVETVIKLGSDKEKRKCLEVLVLADERKYGDDQPNKTELRVISRLRSVLLHPELAFTVKYVRSLSPLGPVSFVLKTSALFSFQVLMGWGFYALDVGTDAKFCSSMFLMKVTDNLTLADRDNFAYLGTIVNHSNPILAVENGEDFIIAGIISAIHVGISVIASMVLFLSTECGHFSRESLYRLPIPFVTKTRGFYLEYQKLKILRKKRSDKKTIQIRKWENRIQKHSDWINLSLMTEASFESSFQFLFQSMLAVPATFGLLNENLGSLNILVLIGYFSILASFVSFAGACVSIRYIWSILFFVVITLHMLALALVSHAWIWSQEVELPHILQHKVGGLIFFPKKLFHHSLLFLGILTRRRHLMVPQNYC